MQKETRLAGWFISTFVKLDIPSVFRKSNLQMGKSFRFETSTFFTVIVQALRKNERAEVSGS